MERKIMSRIGMFLLMALIAFNISCKSQNFFWSHTGDTSKIYPWGCLQYGLLYNGYAVTDVRNIANTGWSVPTNTQYTTLITYLGGTSVAGGSAKDTSSIYWLAPNTGATNISEFNGRGTGIRASGTGVFSAIQEIVNYWIDTGLRASFLSYTDANFGLANKNTKNGSSIRLIKDSTTLSDGEEGIYTGNDGRVYRTICIGTQEWLADNLIETKFRNGDIIPFHGADNDSTFTDAEWAALTTAGVCAYGNDLNYIGCNFTFPEEP